jgi:hypothetical protein
MTDDVTTTAAPATSAVSSMPQPDAPTERRCPWCSELLPAEASDRCPSCKANLVAEGETRLPGLTEVEAPTAARVRRSTESPKRSKLLSWISGEIEDESLAPNAGAPEALELPARDVRREMLRLKLEAEGLTIGADGSIALPVNPVAAVEKPVDAALAEATPAPSVDADPAPADTADALEDIRKAS